MKKRMVKEVCICDVCGKEADYPQACMCCKAEICFTCREKRGVSYSHGVYFSGSGDGFYCKWCDEQLRKSGTDAMHSAYLAIASLRQEAEDWSNDFKARVTVAEEAVKRLNQ